MRSYRILRYYFFDEPMIGLDPKAIRNTKRIFRELKEAGKTILVSTHLIDSVETIADRIMILKNGNIIGNDTLDNLKQTFEQGESGTLEDIFLELTKDE